MTAFIELQFVLALEVFSNEASFNASPVSNPKIIRYSKTVQSKYILSGLSRNLFYVQNILSNMLYDANNVGRTRFKSHRLKFKPSKSI